MFLVKFVVQAGFIAALKLCRR